jgi:hypothetical protein
MWRGDIGKAQRTSAVEQCFAKKQRGPLAT